MDDDDTFDELCRNVYVAARSGSVDCDEGFYLASSWMDRFPQDPDATELVFLSMECVPDDRSRIAETALRLLATIGYSPGFPESPELLDCLKEAMSVVNQDVAASGFPGPCQLRVRDNGPGVNDNAYVATWNGHGSNGMGIYPASGKTLVWALAAVTEDAQDAVMHELSTVWPVCPVHRLGAHAEEASEDAVVWWCSGDGGHAIAAVGEWPRS